MKTAAQKADRKHWQEKHLTAWRAMRVVSVQKWRKKNPRAHTAQQKVFNALKSGKLKRPDHCSRCGLICKPQAHHRDYEKPLEVIWLCHRCHNAEHGRV